MEKKDRLNSQVKQLAAEMASYPERDGHIQQLDGYISNGDASMAEFMANQICERQRNIRQLQLSGLPVGLQALVNQLTAEMVSYPERDEHIRQLGGYISNGDVSMAEFMANQICERQRNIRQLQLSGLPVGLQTLVNQLTAEMVSYPERDEHIRQLGGYISNGDVSMAEFMANQICERQRNIRQLQLSGLPVGLQTLVNQLTAEMVSYPERDEHIRQLGGYISNGDVSMAEFMANQICERQRNIRQLQLSGLPVGLQALVNQLTAEMASYPERDEHIRQLDGYISNGDVSMAEFMANQICERQRNVNLFQN